VRRSLGSAGFTSVMAAILTMRSLPTTVRFQLSTDIGAILTLLATVPAGLPAPCPRSSCCG